MSKLLRLFVVCGLIAGHGSARALADTPPLREIFIPFADLHVILAADTQRVFMSREEFESLAAQAKQATSPEVQRQPAAVLSANYTATIEETRARLLGTLVVTAPDDNLSAIALDLSGVALRSATLDGAPAALGRNAAGAAILFVRGAVPHELRLEILAPLETATAQRTLSFEIPTPPATKLQLTVPGQVEIKSGATVISRTVDDAKNATTFDLLPKRGPNSLVLSLNNRQLQKDRVVVAQAVVVDEITSAYERLHVTASMSVLHGGAERFRFVVPAGFEITSVAAPEVSRWSVTEEGDRRVLDVALREPATGTMSLGVVAIRAPARLGDWQAPKLTALDVAGQVMIVGLLVDNRLQPSDLLPKNLISIDAGVVAQTVSASLADSAGTQSLTAVAAFYAPQTDYDLTAKFTTPAANLRVLTNVLLTLENKALSARGGFVLSNMTDKLLGFDMTAPAGWQVTEVTPEGGAPVVLETYPTADGGTRIHVRLPQAVAIGGSQTVFFRAVSTPDGWLDDWQAKRIMFPQFQIVAAARDVGAIAVQSRDDLLPRAVEVGRLTPLDSSEKSKYGLEDVPTELAYRYDAPPYALELSVARVHPRLTARTLSFFRIEPDLLSVHAELIYHVSEARTNRLAFALPSATPDELRIRGLDGVTLKDSTSKVADGVRQWTVELAEPARGAIRLAIDFQQPLGDKLTDVALPLARALDVAYQSGTVAVEGSVELDVQVKTALRKIDVGELAEADYQPGARLLGAFGYLGDEADVQLSITRPAGHELPTAIVERAELLTVISASGRAQTAARFVLRAKAQMIEMELPAGATLWSAHLDNQPTLPQREGDKLLINLPGTAEAARRDLQLVYETPVSPLGMSSSVDLAAPRLLLHRDGRKETAEVPLANFVWHLSTPNGFDVVRSDGTVYDERYQLRHSPLSVAARAVRRGLTPFGDFRRASKAQIADYSDRMDTYQQQDDVSYNAPEAAAESAPEEQTESIDTEAVESKSETLPDADKGSFELTKPADVAPNEPPPAKAPFPDFTADLSIPYRQDSWALEGLHSLPIDLQTNGAQTTFQSLGESPRLSVTVVDRRRFDLLGWAVALVVFLRGVQLTWRSVGTRFRYVLIVMVVSLALPLALPWSEPLAPLCDMAFFAACWLAPYYLVVAILRWCVRFARNVIKDFPRTRTVAATATSLLLLVATSQVMADEPLVPVKVPEDAIIVPYDPEKDDPLEALEAKPGNAFAGDKARRILVPYAKYLELRKAAQDGKPPIAPPAEYALAGAAFSAELDGGESLVITGSLDVDVFVDRPVSIPLALGGGVLTKATGDGAILDGGALAVKEKPQAAEARAEDPPLRLLVTGPGRKRIDLALRFRLQKRGGWQIAEGRLPVALAAALSLTAAKAGTEITLVGGVDRGTIVTTRPNERIETALTDDGAFNLQWRAKTGLAPVDQSLAARSTVLLDVQEDGLRLDWHYQLEFRRGTRESFTIVLPEDYLVEQVHGANVRGWRVVDVEGARRLEVALLKAAQGTEAFSVALSRRTAVGAELAEFIVPQLSVADAAQQSGEITIRRSPRLELRTEKTAGVSRADNSAPSAAAAVESSESPLGIRPYQAYRFAAVGFSIKLSAKPVVPRLSAELQTVLKISERQRTLESRIRVRAHDGPIYRVRISVPAAWKLDRVAAPDPFEWNVKTEDAERVLSVYFATGRRQPFDIILSGTLGEYGVEKSLPLPRIAVIDADERAGPFEQSGEIVIQADPSLSVRTEALKNIETELLFRANLWLAPAQQALARVALTYRTADYAAEVQLTPRTPSIKCDTITNIRVTQRSVEETILLDFTIRDAGIRTLSFLLPASMQDARISAPMLRQKSIEPVADDPARRVRVRLELQDAVMDNLRVLVESDRLMPSGDYLAPIPVVETGETEHRYITLESAGRDELVVAAQQGVDPLGQEQAEWRMLTSLLGRGLTQAYLVRESVAQPTLALKAKDRAAVETAGARIGLAKVTLVLDANGAFRGEQLYRVDNNLEQYLEVALPAGAHLWTAHVAGEPVKPAAGKAADVVRIPLVKTAPGDADYAVVLKYGGELGQLSSLDQIAVPLIRTLNIHVELSQAEVYLPQSHRWFDFGGTMRLVQDEGDLTAGWLAYNTKQISRARQSASSSDAYSRARAKSNLKRLQVESEQLKQSAQSYRGNEALAEQIKSNTGVQHGLLTDLQAEPSQPLEALDNRVKLRERFEGQINSRGSGVVNQAGENFDAQRDLSSTILDQRGSPEDEGQGQAISGKWLAKNKLDKKAADTPPTTDPLTVPQPVVPSQTPERSAQPQAFGKIQQEPGESRKDGGPPADGPSLGDVSQRQLQRYTERLSLQDKEQAGEKADTDQRLAPRGGAFVESGGGMGGGRLPHGPAAAQSGQPPKATALASLDVDLQPRGMKYAFTTPRGEVEISARAISRPLAGRAPRLLLLLMFVLVVVAIYRKRSALPVLYRARRQRLG